MKRQILPQSVTVQKVFLAFLKRGAIIIEIFKRKSVEKAHIPAIFREKERKNMKYMIASDIHGSGAPPSYAMHAPKMPSR